MEYVQQIVALALVEKDKGDKGNTMMQPLL